MVRFSSVLVRLASLDGNSIIYGRQSGFPLAIALTLRFIEVFFYFFAVSTAVDNDVGVEPTRRSNGRRWRRTISPLRVVPEARPPLGFTKFNSTVRKAAGWSNFALPPPRNCRLTNILQRKLRKLHEERDQTVNCLDFYVTA